MNKEKNQEYVVGFMFNFSMTRVVLIRKNRPGWQAGKLNGVGGHIEEDETPEQAMAREFLEETGVASAQWVKFCIQEGPDFIVHYFYWADDACLEGVMTLTDEVVDQFIVEELEPHELVPHVGWLLMAAIIHNECPDYSADYPGEHFDRKTDSYTYLGRGQPPPVISDQPPPVTNDQTPVWELVIQDMRARDNVGRERYGTPLQAHNGRDALVDAYQEALDLTVYLRQAIEERNYGTVAPVLNKILPGLKS